MATEADPFASVRSILDGYGGKVPPPASSGDPLADVDHILKQYRPEAKATETPPPSRGGIARNVAASSIEGGGDIMNVATNPSGNLLGKPLATAIVFAHDAFAPVFGYQRFPADVRNALLGDTVPQIGTRVVDAAGTVAKALGGDRPEDVTATTPAEKIARTGGRAAMSGYAFGGPRLVPAFAGGAVGGQYAGEQVPEWSRPMTELIANVLAGGLVEGARQGTGYTYRTTADALDRFVSGADKKPLPGPRAPPPNPLEPPPPNPLIGDVAAEPPPPARPPADPVAQNVARFQAQIGVRPEPPPVPAATPAEGAPGFVPPGANVPTGQRIQAVFDAEARQPQAPAMVPRVNIDPLTGERTVVRVPDEANPLLAGGPPTVPYAPKMPEPPPVPTLPEGERSVGAAGTPFAEARLTPEEVADYGSTADKQWLYKSMTPGEADWSEKVRGILPTRAQAEQTAVAARAMKTARNLSPEAEQLERELLDEHNSIRKDEFGQIAGSDVTQGAAIRKADQAIDEGLKAAYAAGGRVDAAPIQSAIQGELAAPSGKLPAVKAVMKIVGDALQKSDGTGLETDPRQVNGARRVILSLQSKHTIAENPSYGSRDVQAALIRVKNVLDNQMEPAAPGFGQAIAQYAEARRAIEAAEAMQKYEPKLYDTQGRMQFSRLHNFMRDVIVSRDPRAPLNPYQSFTPEQMERLKLLHDDLMRVASAEDLAKAKGSDTAANVFDAITAAVKGLPGTIAAGAAGHMISGPAGVVVGPIVKEGVTSFFSGRAQRAATEQMREMLRPTRPREENALGSRPPGSD